jgi:hypothetical protein|tara:strand:+ start:490 stop:990 length:501 start_codon:yes stop_codon:yes gene_type:complete
MQFNISKKLFFITTLSLFFVGCSQKNNSVDIDLSNLPKPKKDKLIKKVDQTKLKPLDKKFISDLVQLEDKEQVLANFKFGKIDPFSQEEIVVNKLSSELKLKGFLTTSNNKYVLVNYLDMEGTITEESIGGVNTNLLPNLAKVLNIDPKNKKLIIFYENEKLIFEL